MIPSETIRQAILTSVLERGAGKTICPSEVARVLSDDWRDLMPAIRAVAAELQQHDQIVVTQKGTRVDIADVRGPVRLGLPHAD